MIDWSATGAMLSGMGTVGGALAIVGAAILGRKAVSDFRQQKQVEREIEYAEKALACSYKIESALSSIRSPMSTGPELSASESELENSDWFKTLSDQEQKRYVQSNVFYQRIRNFNADFDDAISVLPLVNAYFGSDAEKALRDLINCRHSVRVYADAYARDSGQQDPDFRKKVQSYIWEGATPDGVSDPIVEQVTRALGTLELKLIPTIRSLN